MSMEDYHNLAYWGDDDPEDGPPEHQNTEKRDKMTGTVKKFDSTKGYGFIKGEDDKEYFFHRSALKNIDPSELEIGREVTFEDSEGSKGLRAEDIYV